MFFLLLASSYAAPLMARQQDTHTRTSFHSCCSSCSCSSHFSSLHLFSSSFLSSVSHVGPNLAYVVVSRSLSLFSLTHSTHCSSCSGLCLLSPDLSSSAALSSRTRESLERILHCAECVVYVLLRDILVLLYGFRSTWHRHSCPACSMNPETSDPHTQPLSLLPDPLHPRQERMRKISAKEKRGNPYS